mgnify:CR=1 FL=1
MMNIKALNGLTEDLRILEFEEKPRKPKSNMASMGVYVFSWKKVKDYLVADSKDEKSSNDFGKNIIPKMQASRHCPDMNLEKVLLARLQT